MINIGNHAISSENPFIIAEIGSNWQSQEDCLEAVREAKRCGADAVKFQLFNFKGMYGLPKKSAPSWYDPKNELPIDFLNPIHHECNSVGIQLMFSAFDEDLLRVCDPFVPCHKIASSKITNRRFIEKVGGYGKPVFMSCGAASEADIFLALGALGGCSAILNYCVAAYPAHDVDLFAINQLKKSGLPVGISDHTRDISYIPRAAILLHGAVSVEKHLTCIRATTPDSGHSLNPVEFRQMVDYIRGRKKTYIGPRREESDMIMRHRDRWVATATIKEGERLSLGENYGAFRSIDGTSDIISPFRDINGMVAKRLIQEGHCIGGLDV